MQSSRRSAIITFSCVFIPAALVVSCGSANSGSADGMAPILIQDEATLNDRLSIVNEPVSLSETGLMGQTKDFSLTLVGELEAPVYNGQKLQATDVHVSGSKIYLSYNVQGEVQMGAIELIDGGDISKLRIKSQVIFPDRDINALHYRSSKVYITGALAETSTNAASRGAFVGALDASGHSYGLGSLSFAKITSFAGTDIYADSKSVLVTSGDQGGLTVFDRKTMEKKSYEAVFDARSVASDSKIRYVLTGQPAKIHSFNDNGLLKSFEVGGARIAQSKSTLILGKMDSLASVGEEGWKITCNESGKILNHIDPVKVPGIAPELTVTNAVTESHGLVFAANGEAGVHVYSLDKTSGSACAPYAVNKEGSFGFAKGESANHIYARHNYIFVASGKGGLKILSLSYKDYKGQSDKIFESGDDDEKDDD